MRRGKRSDFEDDEFFEEGGRRRGRNGRKGKKKGRDASNSAVVDHDEVFEKPKRTSGNVAFGGHGEEWKNTPFAKRMGNNKKLRSERETLALQAKIARESAKKGKLSGKAKKAALKAKRAQKEEKRRLAEAKEREEREKQYAERIIRTSSPAAIATPPYDGSSNTSAAHSSSSSSPALVHSESVHSAVAVDDHTAHADNRSISAPMVNE